MTVVIEAERLRDLIELAERAIEADEFVEVRFSDMPVPNGDTGGAQVVGKSGTVSTRDRHPVEPARSGRSRGAGASTPRIPPSPAMRAPYLRREQRYRRRGAWMEWRSPQPWRQWLAAAAWLYLAAHLAAWVLR